MEGIRRTRTCKSTEQRIYELTENETANIGPASVRNVVFSSCFYGISENENAGVSTSPAFSWALFLMLG